MAKWGNMNMIRLYLDIMNEPKYDSVYFDRDSQTDSLLLINQQCQTEFELLSTNTSSCGNSSRNLTQTAREALFWNHWRSLNKQCLRKSNQKRKLLKFNRTSVLKIKNRRRKIKCKRRKQDRFQKAPWKP